MNTEINQTPPIPQQPVQNPPVGTTQVIAQKPSENNMLIYMLIAITVLVLVGLIGFIVITVMTQNSQNSVVPERVYVTSVPTQQPTPTEALEEEEATNITIEDPTEELKGLETDLNSLE